MRMRTWPGFGVGIGRWGGVSSVAYEIVFGKCELVVGLLTSSILKTSGPPGP